MIIIRGFPFDFHWISHVAGPPVDGHHVQDKVIFGKGIFYFGGNRGRGQVGNSGIRSGQAGSKGTSYIPFW